MPKKRGGSRGNGITTLLALIIVAVVGYIYSLTGNGSGEGQPPLPTNTSQAVPPTGSTPIINVPPANSGQWWEVYFTDPLTVNDPAQWQNSVEGRLIEKINAAQGSIHIAAFGATAVCRTDGCVALSSGRFKQHPASIDFKVETDL